MTEPYVVFVFDTAKPFGGWNDVLRKNEEVLYFDNAEKASKAGRVSLKTNFPNNGQYQVVNVSNGKLIGIGGYKTGRKPRG